MNEQQIINDLVLKLNKTIKALDVAKYALFKIKNDIENSSITDNLIAEKALKEIELIMFKQQTKI